MIFLCIAVAGGFALTWAQTRGMSRRIRVMERELAELNAIEDACRAVEIGRG